jgi:hypothetical protein
VRNTNTENGEFGLYIGSYDWPGEEGKIVFYINVGGNISTVV